MWGPDVIHVRSRVEVVGHLLAIDDLGDTSGIDIAPVRDHGACSTAVGAAVGHLDRCDTIHWVNDGSRVAGEQFPTRPVEHVSARKAADTLTVYEVLKTERALQVVAVVGDRRWIYGCIVN